MTARKPLHTDFSVTCFAQQQYHLAVPHLEMLHGDQPLVPPCHLSHCAPVHCGETDEEQRLLNELWLWLPCDY